MTHTPGPWYVLADDEYAKGCPFVEVSSGDLGTPGYRSVAWAIADVDDEITKEDRANAALIAAAPETAAERDRLAAENAKLWEALDGMVLVCGRTGNSLDDFEEQAAEFQRETGKMRPGKDVPEANPGIGATREEYRAWVGAKIATARAVLGGK